MLRHMEHGRFKEAWRALRLDKGELPAPPHALARLGRWLADRGEYKKAALPLRRFLDTYPNHQDVAVVENDLACCLKRLGKTKELARLVGENPD
jgi:Flp pilus assembly protein TadD